VERSVPPGKKRRQENEEEGMSGTLRFVSDELQLMALGFMAIVYFLRIRWLLRFPAGRERQTPSVRPDTSSFKGIVYSWANIAMPWSMESTRQEFFFYAQFVIFHLAVAANIIMSFVIPYVPSLMKPMIVVRGLQVLFALGCLIGCYRLYRRLSNPFIRQISSPDDFFSLILLTVWMFVSFWAAPNRPEQGEGALMAYFIMTAFFLVYVPFSKISHYLYYPFTRYYFGKTMGYRGVYPIKRRPHPKPTKI
jgi:nitrate reductase gamma subunit